jgi:hypothetical protein
MNLPSLQNLTNTNRRINSSKELNPIPILIQLCMHSDENYAYRTMRLLLSPRYHYSPNVYDKFGCNVLMYALRYQRYRLFEYLLNDISLDINFHVDLLHEN